MDFGPHQLETLRTEHAHRRLGFTDAELEAGFAAAGFGPVTTRHLSTTTNPEDGALITVLWSADLPHNAPLSINRRHRA